jgi:hypothetical protein
MVGKISAGPFLFLPMSKPSLSIHNLGIYLAFQLAHGALHASRCITNERTPRVRGGSGPARKERDCRAASRVRWDPQCPLQHGSQGAYGSTTSQHKLTKEYANAGKFMDIGESFNFRRTIAAPP